MTIKERLEKISALADKVSDVSYLELKALTKKETVLDARTVHDKMVLMISELMAHATMLEYSVR